MRTIKLGLIALGRIGTMYAKLVEKTPGVSLSVVVDKYTTLPQMAAEGIHPERLEKTMDGMLGDASVEAVIIAASTPSHEALCKAALLAGKHVLCEKPVSFDPGTVEAVGKLAVAQKRILQIGYVRRFDPHFNELKRRLDAGEAGRIHMLKIINRDPARPPLAFAAKSGGLFIDFMVHDFDMIQFLTGCTVKKVYTEADVMIEPKLHEYNDFDTAMVTLRLSSGTIATVDCSRETGFGYDQRIEVFGSEGCLRVENVEKHTMRRYSKDGVASALPRYSFIERYREAFEEQLHHFIAAIHSGNAPEASYTAAVHSLKVALACKTSAMENRPVFL